MSLVVPPREELTSMMRELSPCPRCGKAQPIFCTTGGVTVVVSCTGCRAETTWKLSYADAVKAWEKFAAKRAKK